MPVKANQYGCREGLSVVVWLRISGRQGDGHTLEGPDGKHEDAGDDHQEDTGWDAILEKFSRGELATPIGYGIGGSAHQKQEGHTRRHQRYIENDGFLEKSHLTRPK